MFSKNSSKVKLVVYLRSGSKSLRLYAPGSDKLSEPEAACLLVFFPRSSKQAAIYCNWKLGLTEQQLPLRSPECRVETGGRTPGTLTSRLHLHPQID
eukprot:SAG31_NODE_4276_length_3386_cov_1.703681_4_plen_97_part_00